MKKIPTAPIVCSAFTAIAETESKRLGMHMRWAEVEYPLAGLSPSQREEKARSTYPRIIEILTQTGRKARDEAPAPHPGVEKTIRLTGHSVNELLERMNAEFLEQHWGDGFPLVPPTKPAVDEMLSSISLPPEEVIGSLYPGQGKATVKKIAVNAVMAGCRPDCMPVLVSAVRAISSPEYNQESTMVSTGAFFPFLVVNGPIAKKIGMNGGRNAFGPCCRANATIGRAIRLMIINIGGAWPGVSDMSVLGHPGKYTCCIAENSEASPWSPLSEELGFPPDRSTVTAYPGLMMGYATTTGGPNPEDVLQPLCEQLSAVSSTVSITPTVQTFVILNPFHARKLHEMGLTKQDVKRYIYENTRFSREKYNKMVKLAAMETKGRKDLSSWPDATVSLFDSPDRLFIMVASKGSEGRP